MATNKIQDGNHMYLVTAASAESGDPMVIGGYLPCVLLTDADSDDSNKATVATEGVFDLEVEAVDDDGASAVAVGDAIYYDSGDDPVLTKKSAGEFFGVALEDIASGSDTINVMLRPKAGVGGVDEDSLASALQDKIPSLDISWVDETNGTATVTIQAQDAGGNNLAANVFTRLWVGTADDKGSDSIHDIAVDDGTVHEIIAAEEENIVISDATGLITLVLDTDGADSVWLWAELGGIVYESGEIVITSV